MPMHLYDSLKRRLEPFEPLVPGHVGIYVCGPTVYSEPHLGHARGPVVFDVLRRWLERQGNTVRYVSNITDVGHLTDDADDGEDKLARRAKLERLEPMEVAEKYFWAYFDAMQRLGVRRPSIVPRATGHVTEQIALTQELIDRGLAYEAGGSVYFDVSAWSAYGELSGRDTSELVEGTRVEVRSEKRDPRDFALWKRAEREHIMRWPSPWGEGFPGWHVECSVMSTKYLGDEFDIHGGGLDLVFPHHECELAQARGAGKPFARYWLHWNMLTLGGEKMSKSKGHVVDLATLFEQVDPMVVRFHLLRSHYRSLSDFADEALQASAAGLKRLRSAYASWPSRAGSGTPAEAWTTSRERFAAAMDNDLNTPEAIAVLFDVARDANKARDAGDLGCAAAARSLFDDLLIGVLGVDVVGASEHDHALLDDVVQLLLEQRQLARKRRDFAAADAIRERLADLGVTVEDTPDGARWRRQD
ncbi:MAG: cysteine--tRNA ligase [Trueperaceae bacterium]|nr:MAG: cysteine--tRNA ligase [Trueperaceae bacterium]